MNSDFEKIIEQMRQKGLYNDIKVIESGQGAYLTIKGKKKLNLCSNNYLGLASDKRLTEAVIKAVKKYGVGTGSVRALSGTNFLHVELEKKLAKFKHAEAGLVLQGGYMANLACIQTLLGKEDIVISDELNHASIIDAIRLAQVGNKFIYKHADSADLEEKLKEASKVAKKPKSDGNLPTMLIVTDGVFSMDGDLAPLKEIVKLAKKYNALTMVDDAHGEGVLGSHGRGIAHHFNLNGQVDLEVGTLSKAFGVVGGFVTGKTAIIEFLRQKARQFLFSNGLSIPDTAGLIAAVEIMETSDSLVKKLWENARYLKENLTKLGFDCGKSGTPITPVMLGDENLAKDFSNKLFENGVYATAIKFPMVALGKARIRVMPSATHSKKDLDFALKVFEKVGKELKVFSN
ncbi:glycine C-acetyltransferase [Candidatus Daviesbacteria bacterium]|nr:glycine C-acetyltransferase [Candidatus Daviesbacteria bacterium]